MSTTFSSKQDDSLTATDRSLEAVFPVDAAPFGRGSGDGTPGRSWRFWVFGPALLLIFMAAMVFLWVYLFPAEPTLAKAPAPPAPETKRKEVGKNVFLEVQGNKRRVVVKATVKLREGVLEGLLCRKQTKEHEYILSADVDARLVHATLVAAGAKPGNPVKFQPRYVPAAGTAIKITLQYEKDGKRVSVPAHEWIRDGKTKKDLAQDWVFGGSQFITDPDEKDKPPVYLANYGDMICLCNMESAMLDLPVRSPKTLDDRFFSALTERIPPVDTAVDVILEPVMVEKKDK